MYNVHVCMYNVHSVVNMNEKTLNCDHENNQHSTPQVSQAHWDVYLFWV